MSTLGFTRRIPENWNKLWLAMWGVTSLTLLVSAFFVSFWIWLPAAIIGFLVPEIVSIVKQNDSLPPLTHTIRHFLPNWAAFPLIYFVLGSIGAHWLGYTEPLRVGALVGLLGWLTDHFVATYARPDPFPYTHQEPPASATAPRMPL
jgi:signal transduction histidine kinase